MKFISAKSIKFTRCFDYLNRKIWALIRTPYTPLLKTAKFSRGWKDERVGVESSKILVDAERYAQEQPKWQTEQPIATTLKNVSGYYLYNLHFNYSISPSAKPDNSRSLTVLINRFNNELFN